MKKLLLSLGLLAGAIGVAQAQASIGLKAGASYTSYSGGGATNAKYQFGGLGGVVANFAVNDLFSVQPELLFSMKGAKAEDTQNVVGITVSSKGNDRLYYIDVPVLAHINAGGLFFELGPQVGFLASAKSHSESSYTYNGQTKSQSDDVDLKDKDLVNTVDFGYAAGLGYQMMPGIGIGLRYNGGFTDLVKNNKNSSDALRNSAFQLYLTYMFGGK